VVSSEVLNVRIILALSLGLQQGCLKDSFFLGNLFHADITFMLGALFLTDMENFCEINKLVVDIMRQVDFDNVCANADCS